MGKNLFKIGHEVPQEWRDKSRIRMLDNKYTLGRKHTLQEKEKDRIAHLGKKTNMEGLKKYQKSGMLWNTGLTKETDERIKASGSKQSKTKKINYQNGTVHPWTGRHHTEESRKKISISHTKERPLLYLLDKCFNHSIKGMKQSEEHLSKRISSRKLNNKEWHSNQTKEKIKLANTGKVSKMKGKRVSEKERLRLKDVRSRIVVPKFDTSIELKMQSLLSALHIEYIAHKYISEIEHKYCCDIFIPSTKTVIEADGDYFHGNPSKFPNDKLNQRQIEQKERDVVRTKEMIEKGYRVIRLWEHEIKQLNLDKLNVILKGGTN